MKNYIYVPGLTETVAERAKEAEQKQEQVKKPKKKTATTKDRGVVREKKVDDREYKIPLCNKYGLNIREASDYFGIGEERLKNYLLERPNLGLYLMNGNRILIKRSRLEEHFNMLKEIEV